MRAHSFSLKDRSLLSMGGYRGMDTSQSPLDVSENRSTDARNLTIEEGIVQKRPGWVQEAKFDGNINGVWIYRTPDTEQVIAHIGARFYRLDTSSVPYGRTDITLSSTVEKLKPGTLKDQRSQAFLSRDRLYIVGCGDYLVYGTWDGGESYELRRVYGGTDTYIPITTQSIGGSSSSDRGEVLDDVNLLTPWRKNILSYPPTTTSGTTTVYYLDSDPDDINEVNITLYTKDGKSPKFNFKTDGSVISGGYVLGRNTGTSKYFTEIKLAKRETNHEYTSIEVTWGTTLSQVFIGNKVYILVPVSGSDFCEIEFPHTPTVEEAQSEDFVSYEDRIKNCEFGVLYGVSGNTDRLFLAGNPKTPNIEYYSYAGLTEDFTYFPDTYYVIMGTSSTAITGFSRLSDNTLAVFKEKTNLGDSTIYYQSGYYKEYTDSSGDLSSVEGLFPTKAGNIGEALLSRYSIADFGGDPVFLSRNGVYGIVLTDNVATADRYTRERSASVRNLLSSEADFSQVASCIWRDKYYLAIGGKCYVADGRYRIANDKLENSYGYEWHLWENIPARVFFELGDSLYFGTSDGRICRFERRYSDEKRKFLSAGELALDADAGSLTYSGDYHFSPGDVLHLSTDGIYGKVLTITSLSSDGRCVGDDAAYLIDGMEVYADSVGEGGLTEGASYFLHDCDPVDVSFLLYDTDGAMVPLSSAGAQLKVKLSGRDVFVAAVDPDSGSLQLSLWQDGTALPVSSIGTPPVSVSGWIVGKTVFTAYWTTPVLCPGGANTAKTLLSLTVTPEPTIRGPVTFGYDCLRGRGASRVSFSGLSFDDTDFREFDLVNFAAAKTIRAFERDFNYIRFRFASSEEAAFSVPRLLAVYKVNRNSMGVN